MKKIFNLLFISLAVALYSSCTPEEEDLFDDSSANRIEATLKADKEVLTSAKNGWLMEYYPSANLTYGGYNILVSFAEDGTVQVASDIYDAGAKVASTYVLKQSAGPVLSFDTHNEIMHFFSDPHNPGGIGSDGKGMEGDFEFTIMEATKDKVILKGKKNLTKIIMTPLAETVAWKDFLQGVQDADEVFSQFIAYKYTEGDFKADVTVSYRNLAITYTEGDNDVTVEAPYIITTEGNIKFREPLVLNGKSIEELKYQPDEKYGTFSPTNGVNALFTPTFPLNYLLLNNDWYFAMSGLGDPQAVARWNAIKTQVMPALGVPWDYALFTPYDATTTAFYWSCGGTEGFLLFNNKTAGDNQVNFTFASRGSNFGITLWNNYNWSYMVYPFNGKTFTLSADSDENPTVITMTDNSNSKNTIKLYKEEILDPFNK